MNRGRTSDTLPRPGRVNQVCKEWLVLEDGALAYQLQQEEVSRHLSDNKQRNATVREDYPHALHLQRQAEEEASRMAALKEEEDRRIAEEIAAQFARKHQRSNNKLEGDINVVGLPLPPFSSPSTSSVQHLYDEIRVVGIEDDEDQWPPPPPPEVDASKEEQEQKDRELAARLQQEEELSEELDRRLAIEAQDEELARLLQEREKLKARRARERARARKLAETSSPPPLPSPLPPQMVVSPISSRGNEIPNIAMAIDPTYQRSTVDGRIHDERRKQRIPVEQRSLPSPLRPSARKEQK